MWRGEWRIFSRAPHDIFNVPDDNARNGHAESQRLQLALMQIAGPLPSTEYYGKISWGRISYGKVTTDQCAGPAFEFDDPELTDVCSAAANCAR